MKKLTHCCTNVPYQDDGLCAYSLKAVPSRPTIIHSLHCAGSTGEYSYGCYPRYRPYRKATNCFAPRILFFTFSSVTPACRSCCSNRIKASFNSFLNSLSITRSSTLGISSSPIDKLGPTPTHHAIAYGVITVSRPGFYRNLKTQASFLRVRRPKDTIQVLRADLQSPNVKKSKTWFNSGLRQDRPMHENGRERCN